MLDFDPTSYGPAVAQLLRESTPCELGPGHANQAVLDGLRSLDDEALFSSSPVADDDMAACCRSGLWLLHNFLDESHRISQGVHTITGSYWHGIMHRREPDFSNAKYWFRRVGDHPLFPRLREAAIRCAENHPLNSDVARIVEQPTWDAFQFVDLCEVAIRGRGSLETLCREVAQAEWQLLFDYCFRKAIGA